jgi:hypothetical protein
VTERDPVARGALVRVGEALQAGDVGSAYAVALGALEDDGPTEQPHQCPCCPSRFAWPGLLDHHFRFAHELEAA